MIKALTLLDAEAVGAALVGLPKDGEAPPVGEKNKETEGSAVPVPLDVTEPGPADAVAPKKGESVAAEDAVPPVEDDGGAEADGERLSAKVTVAAPVALLLPLREGVREMAAEGLSDPVPLTVAEMTELNDGEPLALRVSPPLRLHGALVEALAEAQAVSIRGVPEPCAGDEETTPLAVGDGLPAAVGEAAALRLCNADGDCSGVGQGVAVLLSLRRGEVVAMGLVLPSGLAVTLLLCVWSPLGDAKKEALGQPVCDPVPVLTEERVGERVASAGDSENRAEKDCAAEGDAATEGDADAVDAVEGDAVEVPQADAAKEVVSCALYEGRAVSVGALDSPAEAVNPVGVTSGDEVAEREPTAAVAERVGEGVPGGEAVDAPLAVALTGVVPEVVAQAEARIDAVAALDTNALSVLSKERVGAKEMEAEEDTHALPEGKRDDEEITLGKVLDVTLRDWGADGEKAGEIDGTEEKDCELLPVVLPQAVRVAAAVPLPIALPQAVAVAAPDAPGEPLPMAVPECVPEPEAAAVPGAVHVPPPAIVVVAHAV